MSSAGEPETVESWVDEEHYERLWNIKGLRNAVEIPDLKLAKPLEIETSGSSPLHSKWIFTFEKEFLKRGFQLALNANLHTIFNKGIKEIRYRVITEFRSGKNAGFQQAVMGILQRGKYYAITWPKASSAIEWDWNCYLDSERGATVYIKLSLFNPRTEKTEEKFKRQSVEGARQNLLFLLSEERSEIDTKIVCSDKKVVKCHKEMLKANSPVFQTMLKSDAFSEAQSGTINVTDISGVTMELLVQFMYTGKLLETWRQPDITMELTYAAGKYDMKSLLEYLDNVLGSVPDDSDWHFIISLRKLAEKLSLGTAEAKLTERILNRALSSDSNDDIAAVFGNQD